MKIYLSGPISGIANYNAEAFAKAEIALHTLGVNAINPIHLSERVFQRFHAQGKKPTRYDFMRVDIIELCQCDAIFMLDGWPKSWGAKWERIIAKYIIDIPVYYNLAEIPDNASQIPAQY